MRRLARFLFGVLASVVVAGAAYGAWVFGLAHFDDDYCITSDGMPDGEVSISAPEWEFPMTYRCDYGPGGEVTTNEPAPILFTGAAGGVAVLGVSAIWWKLATGRSSRTEYEGKHRA